MVSKDVENSGGRVGAHVTAWYMRSRLDGRGIVVLLPSTVAIASCLKVSKSLPRSSFAL